MNRKALWWAVLVIGVLLIVAPFAIGLPGKAAAGERMLNDFQPLMAPAAVQKTASYYDNVFVPLGKVAPALNDQTVAKFQGYAKGFDGMLVDGQKLVPALAQAMHMTPQQVQAMFAQQFPNMAAMLAALPAMKQDFGQLIGLMAGNTKVFAEVNGGLAWYEPLVRTMQGNVNDYKQVNSLPNFNLFTWFFVIPGVLLLLISGAGLYSGGALRFHLHRPHPAA